MELLAVGISTISSPFIVIAVFSIITIYFNTPNRAAFYLWSTITVLLVDILPSGFIAYEVCKGRVSDLHVDFREQRIVPMVIAVVGSLAALLLAILGYAPIKIILMLVAIIVNGVVFTMITRYWKITMHASSFASAVLIAGLLADARYLWLLILLFPVCWSRYSRKRHTIWQLVAGASLSAIITTAIIGTW